MKDARLSESESQNYNRLVSLNLLEEDAIVSAVVLAGVGVVVPVLVAVSANNNF